MANDFPDFDTMKQMAEQDPEALERLRQEHVDKIISNAPEQYQARLKGIQFQVDSQRQISKNPVQSCIKISQMMHESFNELREQLNRFTHDSSSSLIENLEDVQQETESADIIAFPIQA